MSLKIGQTIGHYRIVDQLGAGGMGIVYKAQERDTGRLVALKRMKRLDATALDRFKRECRTLHDLSHPNLVTLYDRLLGTYTPAERAHGVAYGLDDAEALGRASFPGLLSIPFHTPRRPDAPDTKVRIEVSAGR